jgi:hypothetical protein
MSEKKEHLAPLPEDYVTLGISCPYMQEAVDLYKEFSQLPEPNGKHRWHYKCLNPETGEKSDTQYTEWIYD